jgi:hypothetical protein
MIGVLTGRLMPVLWCVSLLAVSGCGGSHVGVQANTRSVAQHPVARVSTGRRSDPPGPLAKAVTEQGVHSGTCMVFVLTDHWPEFDVAPRGVSCARAVHVVVLFAARIERLVRSGRFCDDTLCTETPPILDGFVCRGRHLGDDYWSVECRHGSARVYSSAAA